MKLASLAPFFAKKATDIAVVCFYGSDEAVIGLRTYMLSVYKRLGEDIGVSHEEIPTVQAPSLWSGTPKKRCVILSKHLDQKGVEEVLSQGQDFFMFSYGSLTTKSAYFKAYEAHKHVGLVGCYDAAPAELDAFIVFLEGRGLCALTPGAKAYLRGHLLDIIQHLPDLFEKVIMLSVVPDTHLDTPDIEALLPPLAAQKHNPFTQAFLASSRAAFIQRLETFSGKDADTFALTRQLLSLIKMLHSAFLQIQEGKPPTDAVRATRFPGFFGKEAHLGKVLGAHTSASMDALLQTFWDLEKGQKSTHTPWVLNERLLVRAHTLLHKGAPF